jgi:hypothetical protein
LLLALVGTAVVPALAGSTHAVCTTKHHDCGTAPTIKACCCGNESASDQAGPIAAKTTVTVTFIPVAGVLADTVDGEIARTVIRAEESPSRATRVDLPTLFASLLI